jgi:hypothetical protein
MDEITTGSGEPGQVGKVSGHYRALVDGASILAFTFSLRSLRVLCVFAGT